MLDELRKHEPQPSAEESHWMGLDPLGAATRALVMVGISLMIGVAASYLVAPDDPGIPAVASARTAAN
jgi:ABC-type dipeptide/oligopeptide/nickel transport system permease subunit